MSKPVTREEQLLSAIAAGGDILSPITRQEMYLAYLAGNTSISLPEPVTRKEQFLYRACLAGGSGSAAPVIQPLSVTANGTYEAPAGVDGYNPVTVAIESGSTGGGDDSWENRLAGSGTIKWPSGITKIPVGLFYDVKTSNFVFDELPDSVELIDELAFYAARSYTINFTKLPENLITLGKSCFRSKLFSFSVIPAGVESIGSSAFYYNLRLTEITFRGTPTSIDMTAFGQCSNLLTINVPWAEGEVAKAPWGATNATINYNYTEG